MFVHRYEYDKLYIGRIHETKVRVPWPTCGWMTISTLATSLWTDAAMAAHRDEY